MDETLDAKDKIASEFNLGQKAQLDRHSLAESIQYCDATLLNLSSYITKRIALAEEVNLMQIFAYTCMRSSPQSSDVASLS